MLIIRGYVPSDCKALAELFYQTVRTVNANDYTAEQLAAWADGCVDLEAWDRSFSAHIAAVAEDEGGIVGFGDMDGSGYLNRLYVHKDRQRQGIAAAICDWLERTAPTARFVTHASITAVPFFLRRGYRLVREQQVVRRGVSLTNYVMEKAAPLASGSESTPPPGGPLPAPPGQ